MNILKFLLFSAAFILLSACTHRQQSNRDETQKAAEARDSLQYDEKSGLVLDSNLAVVLANCSGCHTTDLIRQNRFTRPGWEAKIRWMQAKQNLWDLGASEKPILDYLEKYYSPSAMDARARQRRAPLKDIEWYNY